MDNKLPLEYEASDGSVIPFETDFRAWMMFENLMLDKDMPDEIKPVVAQRLIFTEPLKDDVSLFLLWFYRCGKPPRKSGRAGKSSVRAYSFEHDEELIYAAFMQCYGIDLCETDMHWWKFKALFDGLSEDTKLHKVMGYRTMELDRNKSDPRTKQYRELKEIYRLPKYLSEEQKNAELKRILQAGYKG